MVFQRAKRVWHVFPRAKTRLYGFIVPPLAEGKVVAPATKGGISEKGSTTIAAFHFPAFPYPAENQTTGLRPMEMHPYPRLRRYFS